MQALKEKRARRRGDTRRIALRRRDAHLRQAHPRYWHDPRPENVDCLCEVAPLYYAKRSITSRPRRPKGRPKYWGGLCGRRMPVDARILARRWMRDIVAGRIDPELLLPVHSRWGLYEKRRPRF